MPNIPKAAFLATKILLPIDFSASSEVTLEAATGLAEQFHAAIHLVHIIPEIPDFSGSNFFPETSLLKESKEAIEDKLRTFQERLKREGVNAGFSIEEGSDIVGSLMRVIKREKTDLVVISTHGMTGWHAMIFGSIAEQVVKQVNCTLLLLRAMVGKSLAEVSAGEVVEHSFVPQLAGAGGVGPTSSEEATSSQKRLTRVLNECAEQGAKTEQRYDQAHSLFTK